MFVDDLKKVIPNPEAYTTKENLGKIYQDKYGINSVQLKYEPIKAFCKEFEKIYVTGILVTHITELDFMVKAAIKHDAKPFDVFFELFVMPPFTMPGGRSNYYQSLGRANRWENKTTYTLFILKIQIAWLRFKNFFNSKLK